ncbi:cysteine desulfurase [Streptomyces lavendulae]
MLDVMEVRRDFPFYSDFHSADRVTYLDNAATAQKPRRMLAELESFYSHFNANVHRGGYRLSRQTTERFERARSKVAAFIGAAGPHEVVFTKNATEALNLVAQVLPYAPTPIRVSGPDDEIVITQMEHSSNIFPWQVLSHRTGARLRILGVTDDGLLDLTQLTEVVNEKTKVVAATHCSNVLGTINPIEILAARARQVGALMIVDAAQSAPHRSLDMRKLGADLLAFTGHKMCGPTGIGVLWGRASLLEQLPPFITGGGMNTAVDFHETPPTPVPRRFETGTPPIAEAIALGAAIDYLTDFGMDAIEEHEHELTQYALAGLASLNAIRILGPIGPGPRGATVSFTVDDMDSSDVAAYLDSKDIAVRAGRHCAHLLCARFAIPASVRASFYLYNSADEVDILLESLTDMPRRLHR